MMYIKSGFLTEMGRGPRGTHHMDRVGDVHMDPDSRPVEAQVSADEEARARALGVLPVLAKYEKGCDY